MNPSSSSNGVEVIKQTCSSRSFVEEDSRSKRDVFTHYIFLIHGWIGHALEMTYVEQSIDEKIHHDKHLRMKKMEKVASSQNKESYSDEKCDRIRVHSVTSNIGKTADGVANGGKRLSVEIPEYILDDFCSLNEHREVDLKDGDVYDVSLSLVGNSLGGLYARYCLSCIPEYLELKFDDKMGRSCTCRINLHYNVFMTLAVPNLGLASNFPFHTSRLFEKIAAWSMGQTGQDLFFFDDGKGAVKKKARKPKRNQPTQDEDQDECIVYTMSTDYEKYLHPLTKFRKRVAYVNSFKTDICCHTTTAGFFSSKSTYPHKVTTSINGEYPFVVATSLTEEDDYFLKSKTPSYKPQHGKYSTKKQIEIQGLIMSNKLDSLGWTKVFIDSRTMSPIKTYRKKWRKFDSMRKWNEFVGDQSQTQLGWDSSSSHSKSSPVIIMNEQIKPSQNGQNGSQDDDTSTKEESISTSSKSEDYDQKSSIRVTSKDFHKYMTRNERLQVPVGHSIMIANSKDACCEKLNRNGRPIVDYIVMNLIDDVNKFKLCE